MLWHWQDNVLTLKVCCWLRVGYSSGFLGATLRPVKPTNRVSGPEVIEIAGNRFLAEVQGRKIVRRPSACWAAWRSCRSSGRPRPPEGTRISSLHSLCLSPGSFPLRLSCFILDKLPALRFHKKLRASLFGLLIHPGVLAKSSLNEDLLAFLSHFGKVFGGDAPELNINERGCCALLVTNCVRLVHAK